MYNYIVQYNHRLYGACNVAYTAQNEQDLDERFTKDHGSIDYRIILKKKARDYHVGEN